MATIASLLVVIGGTAAPLTSSLTKASASVKTFGATTSTSAGTAGTAMSKFGMISSVAAIAAGAALVKFAADSVKAFNEAAGVIAQTEAVIKSTGGAAGFTAPQIGAMATELEHLTKFSDEEVASAENLLLTFTNIGHKAFPDATKAVLDMSTALGQDLKSSSIQLGKALNDPLVGLTALRRVGVAFTEQQVRQIQTLVRQNDLFGAQKIILGEVAKEFGGSASKAAGTFAGQTAQLANAWDDLSEKFGEFLTKAGPPVIAFLTRLVGLLNELQPVMQTLGNTVVDQTLKWDEWSSKNVVAAATLDAMTEVFSGTKTGVQDLTGGLDDFIRGLDDTEGAAHSAGHAVGDLGSTVKRFAGMSIPELHDFREATITAFSAVAGALDGASNDWRMTAEAAVKATGIMAKQQKIMARDLEELDKLNIGDGLTKQLEELGPGMVDAFVRGNKNQRQQIRENLKGYDQATADTTDAVKRLMTTGMHEAGLAGDKGLANGLTAGQLGVESAARAVALAAVAAAKHALEEQSPSKVMHRVGVQFMIGFANGITKTIGTLTDAIHSAVTAGIAEAKDQTSRGLDDLAAQTMEQVFQLKDDLRQAKMFEGLSSDLAATIEDLQSQIDDFSSSIQSGFDSFDLVGGALELPQQLHDNLVASVQAELDAAQLAGESADVIASLEADLAAAQAQSITATTADYTSYLQDQLAATQEFAAGLTQLSAMGLNTATLTDLASQGIDVQPLIDALLLSPDLIASFNQTQKAITDVTNSTIDTLVNDVFGKQLAKAGREADRLSERLAEFADDLQAGTWDKDVNSVLRALERLQKGLDDYAEGPPGGGNGGGNGGSPQQPGYSPPLDPTGGTPPMQPVTIHVHGDVMTETQLVDSIHEGLLKKQKRNVTLGLH